MTSLRKNESGELFLSDAKLRPLVFFSRRTLGHERFFFPSMNEPLVNEGDCMCKKKRIWRAWELGSTVGAQIDPIPLSM
jgi:hypothetical protein